MDRQYKTIDGYVITLVTSSKDTTTIKCEDCDRETEVRDGRYYKYEPSVWLCDDCHDERMDDEQVYGMAQG